jgi:hypothetical protein
MTVRHRLNRGGDRALNRAIHAITRVRMRSCPRTRAYIARRTAKGKTAREIRRCLKRYIARELDQSHDACRYQLADCAATKVYPKHGHPEMPGQLSSELGSFLRPSQALAAATAVVATTSGTRLPKLSVRD